MAGRQSRTDTIALGRLTRHEVCNPFRLSTEAGIPGRTLYNAVEGSSPLTVPDLRLVVAAMARLGQEEDALELVRGLLDLESLGWELRHAPRPAPAESIAAAAIETAGASGEAVAVISSVLADGRVEGHETTRLDAAIAHLSYRAGRLLARCRGAPIGQAALPGVR